MSHDTNDELFKMGVRTLTKVVAGFSGPIGWLALAGLAAVEYLDAQERANQQRTQVAHSPAGNSGKR